VPDRRALLSTLAAADVEVRFQVRVLDGAEPLGFPAGFRDRSVWPVPLRAGRAAAGLASDRHLAYFGLMLVALVPVLCIIAGVLMMALCSRPPLIKLGEILTFWGVGFTMLALSRHSVRLL
jgi:hypothetical protein